MRALTLRREITFALVLALSCSGCGPAPFCWETATCPADRDAGDAKVQSDGASGASSDSSNPTVTVAVDAASSPSTEATGRNPDATALGQDGDARTPSSPDASGAGANPSSVPDVLHDAGVSPENDSGAPAVNCDAGLVACDGICIDPLTDADYCGATAQCADEGAPCLDGEECTLGVCRGWRAPELVTDSAIEPTIALDPARGSFWGLWLNATPQAEMLGRRWAEQWQSPVSLQSIQYAEGPIQVGIAADKISVHWVDVFFESLLRFDGQAWSAPEIRTTGFNPIVAADWDALLFMDRGSGDANESNYSLAVAEWDAQAGVWQEGGTLGPIDSGLGKVAVAGNRAAVAWKGTHDVGGQAVSAIWVAVRDVDGWATDVVWEAAAASTLSLGQVAISEQAVGVTWTETEGGAKRGFARAFANGTWGDAAAVCEDTEGSCSSPGVLPHQDGMIVTWQQPGEVAVAAQQRVVNRIFSRFASGAGWGNTVPVSLNTAGDVDLGRLAGDGGFATYVWTECQSSGGPSVCTPFAAVLQGGEWSVPRVIQPMASPLSKFGQLAAASGVAVVPWIGGDEAVYVTRYARGEWHDAVRVSESAAIPDGTSRSPTAWLSADGSRAIVDVSYRKVNQPSAFWIARFW